MENENFTIALLIDTENVSAKYMGKLEKELILLGRVSYRRMYGDFTKKVAAGWRDIVNDFSLTPVQQYSYTTGKNVTDSKMIIDAMDILYSGNVNAMCLMSSDSDFTGLAKRLKESNIYVIGAGEKKTPESFVHACDRFFILDEGEEQPAKSAKKKPAAKSRKKPCQLSAVMDKIYQAYPSFDYRNYGVNKAYKFFSDDRFDLITDPVTGMNINTK